MLPGADDTTWNRTTDNAPIRSRWTVSRCMGRRDARVTTVQGIGPELREAND